MLKSYLKSVVLVGTGILVGTGLIYAVSASPTEHTYYLDSDGDGYGSTVATTTLDEVAPEHYVASSTDCNDAVNAINPGATEVCDRVDNDCDGSIDEGVKTTFYYDGDNDLYGLVGSTTLACAAPLHYVASSTDCNDANNLINPAATEIYDSLDNNCNGQIDEGITLHTYYQDLDNDNYGNASVSTSSPTGVSGYVLNSTDCNDNNANIHPGTSETYDGVDNNCNGQIDEGIVLNTYYRDADGDTYGNANNSTSSPTSVSGYVLNNTDCNDLNSAIHPNATEIDDDIDNNCNGQIDEGFKVDTEPGDYSLYENHGAYVSQYAHYTNKLKKEGIISGREKGQKMKEAAKTKNENKIKANNGKSKK